MKHGGITAISVAGFKSIRDEQRIEIRPLTILAGANNSGKSSMMQPLLLLKQTLEAPYDPGALKLDGPNVTFTSASEFLSKIDGKAVDGFRVEVEDDGAPAVRLSFKKARGHGLAIECMQRGETRLYPGMRESEVLAALRGFRAIDAEGLSKYAEIQNERAATAGTGPWEVAPWRCFLQFQLGGKGRRPGISITGQAARHVMDAIHVPGYRGIRERIYPRTAVSERFPGTFEPYAASVIEHWQTTKDPRLHQLEQALEEMGLTARVAARPKSGGLELLVGRLPPARRARKNDLVNIADVGFGVSQAVPVLVALLAASPGQLVYLEDPESHLHPRAQTRMAKVLADAARRQVRVVVETHSSLLLRGVQTLVAKGKLSPDLVKLHWFKRSSAGVTRVYSGELDRNGAYGEKWPEDFDDAHLESEGAYLDAAERRTA